MVEVGPVGSEVVIRGQILHYVQNDPMRFPQTANGSPAIVETQSKENSIYDLMGRKVERPQKGNIYTQNGKKFVAK